MKEQELDSRKKIFYIVILISFAMIYFFNLLTPKMSDDLLFDKSIYHSFGDIIRQEYLQYMNWNGRSVVQIILKIFLLLPKGVFDVCNSLCYITVSILVYLNINERKAFDVFLYMLIHLCMWMLSVEFAQTILWVSGACNYLWGIAIILGFVSLYRFYLERSTEFRYKKIAGAILFVAGVLAGWCNENTSGGAIVIVLLLTLKYYFENKKVEKILACGIVGVFIGFSIMIAAPGNMVRGAMVAEGEKYSGLACYISRGLKIFKAVDEYLLVYLVIICLLGVYFYYTKRYSLIEFCEVFVFAVSSLAVAGVLLMTTEPMARAYFGANIFMMIAVLHMIQKIREDDILMIALKNGGIIASALVMAFLYIEEGANLVRIRREIEIREKYILEEKAAGNYQLTLPMLRTEFESKYSWAHEVDISDDSENWNNDIYMICYGIDSMEVLSWDEWEEKSGIEEK